MLRLAPTGASYLSPKEANMAKQKETTASEPKRKHLTPAERVAKIEADLAAAKAKLELRASAQITVLIARRDKLVAQANERYEKIRLIEEELLSLGHDSFAVAVSDELAPVKTTEDSEV